jgi:S1-C subfamily serine protease
MKHARIPLVISCLFCATSAALAAGPEDSVVRVFASMRLPNPTRPWAKQDPVEVMGTGTVIDGKRILTNAHVVIYAGEVTVQGHRGGDRLTAKVVAIGLGIDLAVLSLEDESFFDKHPALSRAEKRPAASEPLVIMGFPPGGPSLAVSRGVVSRIEYSAYNNLTEGLRIQADAVAGPGNSGGPALVGNKMVGLVFRRIQSAALIIPNEEINDFLDDVKDGRYDGKLRSIDHFQILRNESLRKKLGLKASDRGIMVTRPGRCNAGNPLREGDVLTRIGQADVDNEGQIDFEGGLRLPFTALVPRLARDGLVSIRILRDGKPTEGHLIATREDDRLIRSYQGQYPSYFVYGPLVFSAALDPACSTYAEGNPMAMIGSPLVARASDRVTFPGEELVVVTAPMLAHPMMRGYSDPFGQVVKEVDGTPIRNLCHLVTVLRDGKGEFMTIRFHNEVSETLVLARKEVEAATPELMLENGIPRRGSPDVLQVWSCKTAP